MISTRTKICIFISFLFIVTSCISSAWSEPIPDAEIVYQTGLFDQKEIGFVNADGFNSITLKVDGFFKKPVWSFNERRLYGLINGSPTYTYGYPAFLDQEGEFIECRKWGTFRQIEGASDDIRLKEVFISNASMILLVDLVECKKIKVLVDYSKFSDTLVNRILGISYSPNNKDLLYALEQRDTLDSNYEYLIYKMDIKTEKIEEFVEGISPSWSPDGSQIAYVQKDGIYNMQADGTQPRQLVNHTFWDSRSKSFGEVIPVPRWSPDGKWIIYHRCDQDDCFINENTIYKVDLASGQEEKIIYGGGYPDWRSP